MDSYKGSVNAIVYRNVENGYSVVEVFTPDEGLITCVGYFPLINEGEDVIVEGKWDYNNKFGRQFKVDNAQLELPTSFVSIIQYLSSGLFKGVGAATAKNIVDKFKEKTFEVIEFTPFQLSTIRGISSSKAQEIGQTFIERKDMQIAIMYLMSFDLSVNMSMKLYDTYGKNVRTILETNPYQLVKDVDGVGFLTADLIASKIGIELDSNFRIKAAIVYALNQAASQGGNTYVEYSTLVEAVSDILRLPHDEYGDKINFCINQCRDENEIKILSSYDETIVMSSYYYYVEKDIAEKLIALQRGASDILIDLDTDINNYQTLNGVNFHINQINAIKNCILKGVNVITGGPGTGKTTIVKCIIDILKGLNKSVLLCAPTGRASKRLSESTSEDAKTIHRLLGIDFSTGQAQFAFNEDNNLDADVVIVDEISMCDEIIFKSLISAIRPGARLIMLGDKDQLPSVGAGNVLSDIIQSDIIPINYLTQIFRQSNDSSIVEVSHKINEGVIPVMDNTSSDFFFSNQRNADDVLKETVEMVTERIPRYFNITSQDIQVLCPMKKGIAGVINLNKYLQQSLNPKSELKNEIVLGSTIFRVGDRVIHTENNYEMEWVDSVNGNTGTGVFNGEMGVIIEVDKNRPSISVRFEDGRVAVYAQKYFEQISLSYAISIHKSQGSEFKVVILAIAPGNPSMLTRNLLYTGVTRAKEVAVIVSEVKTVKLMICNKRIIQRNTKLIDFMIEANMEADK